MSTLEETAVLAAVSAFLDAFQAERASRDPTVDGSSGGTIVVAFSGGPDSTALLWALVHAVATRRATAQATPRLVAAHLDHGLDPESSDRASRAVSLARQLGLAQAAIHTGRLELDTNDAAASGALVSSATDGVEDWARRRRYAFLQDVAETESASMVVTAHHADDQAETVALRLLYGSGLRGLAGVRPERRLGARVRLVRPLLSVRRSEIERALDTARYELPSLVPLRDPTNFETSQPRSFVRHHLLPHLQSAFEPATGPAPDRHETDLGGLLVRVAGAARRFGDRLDVWLDRRIAPRTADAGSRFDYLLPPREAVSLDSFLALPQELRRHALARLHSRLGRPYPPPDSAVSELERQLDVLEMQDGHLDCLDATLGVDCGDGFRWHVERGRFFVLERRITPEPFTYTFETPGAIDVPEIFLSFRCGPCRHDTPRPWMFRGETLRAGLSLPAGARPTATVRSRRPGDRLRPLGSSGSRRLKDLLIDRKVPRRVRDRLPLLFLDGILAWVPGVTVDECFRFRDAQDGAARQVWTAEIRPMAANELSIASED